MTIYRPVSIMGVMLFYYLRVSNERHAINQLQVRLISPYFTKYDQWCEKEKRIKNKWGSTYFGFNWNRDEGFKWKWIDT